MFEPETAGFLSFEPGHDVTAPLLVSGAMRSAQLALLRGEGAEAMPRPDSVSGGHGRLLT